jgi:hypothetical protein
MLPADALAVEGILPSWLLALLVRRSVNWPRLRTFTIFIGAVACRRCRKSSSCCRSRPDQVPSDRYSCFTNIMSCAKRQTRLDVEPHRTRQLAPFGGGV